MVENYFDHDADIGIIGRGETLEACFADAARAMFAAMANLSSVKPMQTISFEFDESDLEFALVTWLNLLLANANASHMILSEFRIKRKGNQWQAEAKGEVWRDEIERGVDVKGATLTMLSVKKIGEAWEARCVVDV